MIDTAKRLVTELMNSKDVAPRGGGSYNQFSSDGGHPESVSGSYFMGVSGLSRRAQTCFWKLHVGLKSLP